MVPSSVFAITTGGERLSCDGFSLGETISFGSLEFIADRFDGLSLSPIEGQFERCRHELRPWWAIVSPVGMIGDSAVGFPTALDGEGRIDLLTLRSDGTGAQPTPGMTVP
jgi:hypothetical protein